MICVGNPNWPPKEGLIVSCRFPLEENPLEPSKVQRPVLIVEIYEDQTVLVVYGTGQKTSVSSGSNNLLKSQVEVDPTLPECKCSNLQEVTRFDFRKAIVLPYTAKWFTPFRGKSTVVVGHFPKCLNPALNKASIYTKKLLAEKKHMKFGFHQPSPEITIRRSKFPPTSQPVLQDSISIDSENKDSTSDTPPTT